MKPVNHVLLSLDKAFQDEVITEGGTKFYIDTRFNSEWHTTVVGEVAALPTNPKGQAKEIIGQLECGDQVAFSYDVVADRSYGSSENIFAPVTEGSHYYREYVNGRKDVIKILCIPAMFNMLVPKWTGVLVDKKGEVLDGCEGSEHDVERWFSQFETNGVQDCKFNNIVELEGNDYWKVNYDDIFAKKVGDEVVSISDRVICEPIVIDITQTVNLAQGLQLPPSSVNARLFDRAILVSGGEELGLNKGDIVSFPSNIVEKYRLWNKDYFLVNKKWVNGTWRLKENSQDK